MTFKIIRLAQTRFQMTQINQTTTMTQEFGVHYRSEGVRHGIAALRPSPLQDIIQQQLETRESELKMNEEFSEENSGNTKPCM